VADFGRHARALRGRVQASHVLSIFRLPKSARD
jgi:hypothetical protein